MVNWRSIWLREGRGEIPPSPAAWEKGRPMGKGRRQMHVKRRPAMTLPQRLDQLLRPQSLHGSPRCAQRQATLFRGNRTGGVESYLADGVG